MIENRHLGDMKQTYRPLPWPLDLRPNRFRGAAMANVSIGDIFEPGEKCRASDIYRVDDKAHGTRQRTCTRMCLPRRGLRAALLRSAWWLSSKPVIVSA